MTNSSSTPKSSQTLYLLLLTIVIMLLNAQSSIYIELYPQLIHYFHVDSKLISDILRFNMTGFFLGSLISGPLSDCFGRKRIFILGLLLYSLANFACFFCEDFTNMLYCNLAEGFAGSFLMVIGWVVVFDENRISKACQLYGLISGVSAILLAFIPALIYLISRIYDWHYSLLIIGVMAAIAFFVSIVCVEETLPPEDRKIFHINRVFARYYKLLSSFEFVAYALLYAASSGIVVLFFSHVSLTLVEGMKMSRELFSIYQTLNGVVYIIFSFISIYVIARKDIDYANKLGFYIFIFGCVTAIMIAVFLPADINKIFYAMMIATAGNALMNGYLLKAIEIFPDIKGVAMSLSVGLMVIMSARGMFWLHWLANEFIDPIIILVFIYSSIAIFLFTMLMRREKLKEQSSS